MAPVLPSSNTPTALPTNTNIPSLSPLRTSSPRLTHHRRRRPLAALRRSHYDVVVVGAGIVGLSIAREFLLRSDLSVALVDARVPASGATGAGQGYLWMGYRTPGSDTWELCRRSRQLWEELARGLEADGKDPLQQIGWKRTGSLLIGKTLEERAMLQKRVKLLRDVGLEADYLSSMALQSQEPELDAGEGGAAFSPDDCQIDARLAASFIEKWNRDFSSEGRYSEFYNNPAIRLLSTRGEVEAVETSENILYGRRAIIIATGAWSGSVMKSLVMLDDRHDVPVKPRKGHLLVLEKEMKIPLNHGMMEMGYLENLATEASSLITESGKDEESLPSISMTATTDINGNLVLGSSRQFIGFNTEVEEAIIERIWERAGQFLPALRKMSFHTLEKKIQTGLRPWMPDGKPIISPLPSLPKVFLATGHEGDGLCTSLGTAEVVVDMALGNRPRIDHTPFSISRLSSYSVAGH